MIIYSSLDFDVLRGFLNYLVKNNGAKRLFEGVLVMLLYTGRKQALLPFLA